MIINKKYKKSKVVDFFLSEFYKSILETNKVNVKIEEKKLDMLFIPINGDKYFTPKIKEEINKFNYYGIYKFQLDRRIIKIYIFDYEKNDYNDLLIKIKNIIVFVTKYVNKDCVSTLNIYLYMTNLKKILPKNKKITEENINTAYTYAKLDGCIDNNSIFVYRKEEMIKVLIHEMMHAFNIEEVFRIEKEHNSEVNKLFNLELKNLKLEETVAELYATIINILFSSKIGYKNFDEFKESFLNNYENEINNSKVQCMKILKNMNIKYNDIVNKKHKIINLNTDTNMFSYFFLKLIVMIDLEIFLKLCYGDKKVIGCKNLKKIKNIIEKNYKSKTIKKLLNSKVNNKNITKKELRMTITE